MFQRILIEGEFSDSELRELATAIRIIEQRHPERDYSVALLEDQGTAAEAAARLNEIYPVDPSRAVTMTFIPKA